MFYLGVGLLVFFMAPADVAVKTEDGGVAYTHSFFGRWGVNNVAALFLAIVGAIHALHVVRDDSAAPGGGFHRSGCCLRGRSAVLQPVSASLGNGLVQR